MFSKPCRPHSPELAALLEKARNHVMTPRERWLQRVSFAFGNLPEESTATREDVYAEAIRTYGPCPPETDQEMVGTTYDLSKVAKFRYTDDRFGDLHNFAVGMPLKVGPHRFKTSEALYQALKFDGRATAGKHAQFMILGAATPKVAKDVSRANARLYMPTDGRVNMRFVLEVKTSQHYSRIRDLLRDTGDRDIVEITHGGASWGATPLPEPQSDMAHGPNWLGKIWMDIRDLLDSNVDEKFHYMRVRPDFNLLGLSGHFIDCKGEITT
jgi:hypothetical protein